VPEPAPSPKVAGQPARKRTDEPKTPAVTEEGTPPASPSRDAMFIGRTARADILKAIQTIAAQPVGRRCALLDALAASLNPADAAYAIALAEQTGRRDYQMYFVKALLPKLAQADPQAALKLVDQVAGGWDRDTLLRSIAKSWSETDPYAAAKWVKELPLGRLRTGCTDGVIESMAAVNVAEALALADTLPPGRERQNAYATIAQIWGPADPEAAMKWARELPDGSVKQSVMQSIVSKWAQANPAGAAAYAEALPPSSMRNAFLADVGRTWYAADPEAALPWILGRKSDPDSIQTLQQMLPSLAWSDPKRAVELLDRLSSAAARNQAISRIASQWAGRDFAAALAWVRSLPDGYARQRALENREFALPVGARKGRGMD
jgi:hypothetical protein